MSAPGALMLWAEWWGGELNLFLAGLLCTKGLYPPPPSLLEPFNSSTVSGGYNVGWSTTGGAGDAASCVPLDVFPLLTQTLTVAFMSHLGFSLQGAAHIGNLLGANKPHRARRASKVGGELGGAGGARYWYGLHQYCGHHWPGSAARIKQQRCDCWLKCLPT